VQEHIRPGTKFGPYEIVGLLGAGGMGEVYRARDTRLHRDVAIKILPAALSNDPDRLHRFEQEARATAALNHPNILAVHDIGTREGSLYMVAELLEGATLRERLADGPLPVRKAIDYAVQTARGLAAAHEKGIVHRDLKPENIFVTADGRVKILDFGLAKLIERAPAAGGATMLPTMAPETTPGVILGTIGYMAPEQMRGRSADHSADIFALGAVLYEMLSGTRAFHGGSSADVMSAILREDPRPLPAAERQIPPALARIVDRCLEKDPAARFKSADDLAFALEALTTMTGATSAVAGVPVDVKAPLRRRDRLAWVVAGAAIVAMLAALAAALALYTRPAADASSIEFLVPPPQGWSTTTQAGGARGFAISPDGRRLAFVAAAADGRTQIWLRSLDSVTAVPLKGTENAASPFWAPDSRWLAFISAGKLRKIDTAGGPAEALADTAAGPGGVSGSWGPDGTLLFNSTTNGGVYRVAAGGGQPVAVTTFAEGDIRHVRPHFLPDGDHFLYTNFGAPSQAWIGSLRSNERRMLLTNTGGRVAYSQGRLFSMRGDTLMQQPFDLDRLAVAGDASPVLDLGALGVWDVSATGTLAYARGRTLPLSQLALFDRSGKALGTLGDTAAYYSIEISPDGSRAAGEILEQADSFVGDIWLFDLASRARTRLTFDASATFSHAIWSPDGARLVYLKRVGNKLDFVERAADGTGEERRLTEDGGAKLPSSWSRDGRFIAYGTISGSGTGNDIWILPLDGEGKPRPFLQTRFSEFAPQISPDGRWLVYGSNESGRNEIYAARLPDGGAKRQISTDGGNWPRWRADGKEIFWLSGLTVTAASVDTGGPAVEVRSIQKLFDLPNSMSDFPYDVTPDGQRFLAVAIPPATQDTGPAGITIVVNWKPRAAQP
jgi:Tol biopolymer transport system component